MTAQGPPWPTTKYASNSEIFLQRAWVHFDAYNSIETLAPCKGSTVTFISELLKWELGVFTKLKTSLVAGLETECY